MEDLPKGDFPSFVGSVLVMSRRAVEALHDLLTQNGRLLPVVCDKDEYFVFNVTRLVDALDKPNSQVSRSDDGRIFNVHKYSFRA